MKSDTEIDPVAASLRAIAIELQPHGELLREIRDELARTRTRPSRSALLAAVAAAVGDRAFSARELLGHADVDPAWSSALGLRS